MKKTLSGLYLILCSLVLESLDFISADIGDNYGCFGMMGGYYGFGIFWAIIWLLVIIALVLFIIWLAKQLKNKK